MASSDPVETRLVVAIRPRPLAADEAADAQLCFGGEPHTITLAPSASGGPATALPFDRVFDAHAGNGDVYAAVARQLLRGWWEAPRPRAPPRLLAAAAAARRRLSRRAQPLPQARAAQEERAPLRLASASG